MKWEGWLSGWWDWKLITHCPLWLNEIQSMKGQQSQIKQHSISFRIVGFAEVKQKRSILTVLCCNNFSITGYSYNIFLIYEWNGIQQRKQMNLIELWNGMKQSIKWMAVLSLWMKWNGRAGHKWIHEFVGYGPEAISAATLTPRENQFSFRLVSLVWVILY